MFLSVAVSDKQLEYAFWKLAEAHGSNGCRAIFKIGFALIQKLSVGSTENVEREKGDKISGSLHPRGLSMFHSLVPVFKSRIIQLLGWKH